jgi:hypothetical protein
MEAGGRLKTWRRLLPTRTTKHGFFARHGLASIMNGWVELSSLGKLTCDWTMLATEMSEDKSELEEFLNAAAHHKPYPSNRRDLEDRAYLALGGAVRLAEGFLELGTAGHLTADWGIVWMCYGEDAIEWATRFR